MFVQTRQYYIEDICKLQHKRETCRFKSILFMLVYFSIMGYPSRTMNMLTVAYNDSLRMVVGIPRYCSASEMFAYTNVPSCKCVIRLNIYSFMKRIQCMKNEIVHSIVHSDLIFSSLLWLNWRQLLFYVPNS